MVLPPVYIVTGLMGSGKSTVTNYIKYRNHFVIKMDDYAKTFMHNNDRCKMLLVRCFGKDIINDFGALNDDYLKKVYFDTMYENNRRIFEQALDTMLFEDLFDLLKDKKDPVFIEVPAFKKRRFDDFVMKFMDKSIVHVVWVFVNDEERHKRLLNRGMTEEQIKLREALQCAEIPVQDAADYFVSVISNNGTEKDLFNEVTKFLNETFLETSVKKDYMKNRIDCMDNRVFAKFMCAGFKNTFGCESCPFPCKNAVQK